MNVPESSTFPDRDLGDVELSVVIVNYNGCDLLEECLRSVLEPGQTVRYETIVYDNASADHSRAMVRELFPTVRLLEGEANIGLCRAFNKGVAASCGKYVLSLDSDTVILPGALDDMIGFLKENPEAGACGATLIYPDGTRQRTARAFPNALSAVFGRRSLMSRIWPDNPFSRRYMMADKEGSLTPYKVDSLSTACMMVRRSVIETVGAYDERYFVYWSDTDWCQRIKKAGKAIYTLPASTVIHNENIKSGHRKVRRTRMVMDFHRGAYYYYATHHAGALNPMRYVAYVGLHLRAYVILFNDEDKRMNRIFGIGSV